MRLDQYISINESVFTELTKEQQFDIVRSYPHVLTDSQANKLLQKVKCKEVAKPKKSRKKPQDGM